LASQARRDLAKGHLQDVDLAAIASETSVLGRFLITKKQDDIASFKTPDLRNVLMTAPYFHDGSQETLWDVMDHYNKGDGLANPWLDEDIQPLALTEPEIDAAKAWTASREVPWPYESFGRREPQLRRPALREKVRAHAWFVLRGNNCDDSHLVGTLK
jgi:hypothetical protein